MNKLIFSFILFLFFLTNLSSQDLLIKNNGDTLTISIIDLNSKYLVYNNLTLDSLRVFTTPHHKLNRILYASGKVHVFTKTINNAQTDNQEFIYDPEKLYIGNGLWAPNIEKDGKILSSREVIDLYRETENTKSEKLFKKGRTQNIVGNILGFPSGYLLGTEIAKLFSSRRKTNSTALAIGIAGGIISFSLNIHGVNKIKKSVQHYNETVNLTFESTEEGIGFVLKF